MTKKTLTAAIVAGSTAFALLSRGRGSGCGRALSVRPRTSRQATDDAARRFLMYAILPIWSFAGFLDWLWHKQTSIETTSGVKESIMHLVMMAEAGVPILTGMFLEVNAGSLALMASGWLLHEATVAWDVKYTISRRKIFTREQLTHTYMESIPFHIVATFASLYPEQALALLGIGSDKPDFKLRYRKKPIQWKDFAIIVAGMGLVSGLPHLEELWRCYRAKRKGLEGRDIEECARVLFAS